MVRSSFSKVMVFTACMLVAAGAWADDAKPKAGGNPPAKAAKVKPTKQKAKQKAKRAPNAGKKVKAKKVAGKGKQGQARLPKLYVEVLADNPDARAKIANIAAEYQKKLAALRAEIKTVTAQRDAALQAALTPDQRAKLAEMRAKAKPKKR